MNLLSLTDVSLTLGDKLLFENVTLGIDEGERIGFIGPNGAGKSSFIATLRGERVPDSGTIHLRGGLTMAHLPQIPRIPPGATVADLVFCSSDPRAALVREYEQFISRYTEADAAELSEWQARMDREEAWNLETTYHSFLTELGIHQLSRRADTLSGGELRKADMARVLASGADILLLDEPTNHLDLETVEWLENWLRSTRRTYILVTHDRSFLENSCDIILELDRQSIFKYPGNWSTYVANKAKRLEEESRAAGKRANILRRELEWAARRPRARAGKDKKRLSRIESLQDAEQADLHKMAEFSARGRRLGKKVLELINMEKTLGSRRIIAPFSYSFRRGERIGVAGPNGAGKTTFLSLASGEIRPDGGRIDVGVNTRFARLDQSPLVADENLSVLEYIRQEAENARGPEGALTGVSRWLERFDFPPASQRGKIRYLSGGERRRLQLVRLLMREPNFLILDEPTNDLDLPTLNRLEEFLESYEGCLLVVSHDRSFLENIVDFFLILDGSGTVRGFSGSWSEYRDAAARENKAASAYGARSTRSSRQQGGKTAPEGPKPLNYRERKRMDALVEEIQEMENELQEMEHFFSQASPNPEFLAEAGRRYEPLREKIAERTREWEELALRDI